MKATLPYPVIVLIVLSVHNQAQARFIRPQLEATPVDRLVKNLSKQAKPKDGGGTLNISMRRWICPHLKKAILMEYSGD